MEQTIFWIIIAILLFDFLFEKVLDYLNYTRLTETVPEELAGIYEEDKYKKSQRYQKVNLRFSLITGTFSLIIMLAMLFSGGFGRLDEWVREITDNEYLRTLLFFGILGLAFDLISVPFQLYDTFVIEERFGFNKTTPRTFLTDKLKSWLLSLIIGGGLLLFVQWAWLSTGFWFWIIVMGGISLFMIFMAMFYTDLIVPLFNRQTPLDEGELKTAIYDFAAQTGFRLDNVFVIDGSKRSTKANAYFSGLGPKKRVVLYDTLISDLEKEEIVAVLAHEIGHYKKKHIVKGLIMSLAQSALMIWLLWLALDFPALSGALGAAEPGFYMGLLAFGMLFSPVSFFTGIISNFISRKFEFQADAFAGKHYSGKSLIAALVKLSVNNLSNLTPHPVYVFFHYAHPPLLQRKRALEA
ncbi:MAG: M48 family peptidase [Bacteroidetes bacterium]|nr:MAG: M48 family peptidase [Bacteroidota bacterium]RLD70737.1 MAG: M48 family peptidase [Bacteroidota bacterium]RLD86766.1 MAG: M48 family peptidase [Bacteroidota bacterium]